MLPPDFEAALRGDAAVRRVIEALQAPSASCFLLYAAEFDERAVRAVGAVFARELLAANWSEPAFAPRNLRVGTLADVLRHECPTCGRSAYMYCVEWSDRKFDPDWHSDIHALCVVCPRIIDIKQDFAGSYCAASSEPLRVPG